MSGPGPPYPPLPAAVTRDTINATSGPGSDGSIKEFLLGLTSHIISTQSSTSMFGVDLVDRYSPSVQTLYKRLEAGHQAPFTGLTSENVGALTRTKKASCESTADSAMQRDLEDFEDLYYALLAAVKSMHNTVILRLNNNFNNPNEPLSLTSGYTVHEFQEWLLRQWILLNDSSLVLALDNAIRGSLADTYRLTDALPHQENGSVMSQQGFQEADTTLQCTNFLPALPGLELIGDEHPAMICGRLNEKYRPIFQAEKETNKGQDRRGRKFGKTKKAPKGRSTHALWQGSEPEMQLNWPPQLATQAQGPNDKGSFLNPSKEQVPFKTQPGYSPTQQPVSLVSPIQEQPMGSPVNAVHQHNMKLATVVNQDHSQREYSAEAEGWQQMLQAASIHHPQHELVSYHQSAFQSYPSNLGQGTFASVSVPLERQIAVQQVAEYTDWLRALASDGTKRLAAWPNQPQPQPSWNGTPPYTFGYRHSNVDEEEF